MATLADMRRERAAALDALNVLRREFITLVQRETSGEAPEAASRTRLDELNDAITQHEGALAEHDGRIERCERALEFERQLAVPVTQAENPQQRQAPQQGMSSAARARSSRPDYDTDPSLVVGGLCRMLAAGGGTVMGARMMALEIMGERNPVTEVLHGTRGFDGAGSSNIRSLMASIGPSGGFLVPPDYVASLIEILRPNSVVRASGPRMIEMPRGTMQMPRQNQAATASYGGETTAIPVSQQAVGQIVATYKKLMALTPVTNDLMRYSDPAVDALVRDDLAQVIIRREDLAFIRGDGTQDSPMGFRSFALPGNYITSNPAYTLLSVSQELGGALNKIETANVPMENLVWIMHPRSKNYMLNVQNANGFYVYREEMTQMKTLLGWPFKTTTQIPINLVVGPNADCSEIYLVAMSQAMLFDSMRMELAVSREGTYVDANGALVSVFQQDQTMIRAISEHDFHMRHDEAISLITGVRYAPAIQ